MNNFQHSVDIVIADFSIHLYSDSNIELEAGYEPFISKQPAQTSDINIHCITGLPALPFKTEDLVFEAKNDNQKFYSIYRLDDQLGFVIYNQQTKDDIQQIAVLDKTFTHWTIYSELTPDNCIPALKYPMGPIVMLYMTLNAEAVLMHASCAFDGKNARLFSGFSGAGKSTMSKIWSDAGSQIINDDRLVIRKRADGFFVYNTPMYYKDIPKSAPLSSVYLISHSPENKLKKLQGAQAISKVMAFCIQNNYDKEFIQSRLQFFSQLCSQIPVSELGFVPNESVVSFILANEKGELK
jgi:hypothetical protein